MGSLELGRRVGGNKDSRGKGCHEKVKRISWYPFLEKPRKNEPKGRGTLPFSLTFQTKVKKKPCSEEKRGRTGRSDSVKVLFSGFTGRAQ